MKPLPEKRAAIIALLATVVLLLLTVTANAVVVRGERNVMGTVLEMTVVVDNRGVADRAFNAVEAEFKRVEMEMSEWREDSPLSLLNRNAGVRAVEVSDELFKVVSAALAIARLTEGAFDISWAAMHGVWDFRAGHERLPDKSDIKARLPLIDYRAIEVDPLAGTVYLKKSGMKIGLGGIAKGYAVDRAAGLLAAMGIENFIIRAGGDMRVQGSREESGPWKIEIKHPRERGSMATLSLTSISISTSGDYERFFIKDGALYHHIMDPRTGYPARGSQSVTVLAPDTMTSDALSTALFVLGPEAALRLVERLKGIEAIIVDSSGALLTSSGMERGAALRLYNKDR